MIEKIQAAILAIGDELLSGDVADTNSAFLCSELRAIGVEVVRISSVKDDIDIITRELAQDSELASVIITTGGLGPTTDDLTRDGIARFVGKDLTLNESSLEKLKENAKKRKRPLHKNNERQAYFPAGSTVLPNPVGTADAFVTQFIKAGQPRLIISLPGIPGEMRYLFSNSVVLLLTEQFPGLQKIPEATFKCFGLSESGIGQAIEGCNLGQEIRVAYRPVFPEVWVKLSYGAFGSAAKIDSSFACEQKLAEKAKQAIAAIGPEFVFTNGKDVTLSAVVGELLTAKKLRISCAESCSSGLVASEIVKTSGASNYFQASFVTYANSAKEQILAVNPAMIEKFGAVSREVAIEMAEGARRQSSSDVAVSVTGIAGPDGGSPEKPVGTVWLGISSKDGSHAVRHFYPMERNRFRVMCAHLALDLVRRELLGLPLQWDYR